MDIREVSEEELKLFLANTSHSIIHTPSYKRFIEEAFGVHYTLLGAVEGESIRTLLPFVEIKSLLFGNKIISSAYLEYGGFAGEEKGVFPLLEYLEKNKKNHKYLEIRGGGEEHDPILTAKLVKKDLYKRCEIQLSSEQEVWRNIQESKRKAIRKSQKKVEIKDVPAADVLFLYELYCCNMQRFGSPPYAQKYFESFFRNMVEKGLGKVVGCYYNGKLISALLGLCYGERVHIFIAVSDLAYQEFRPNDAMHWHFIKWALENKYKVFDFGKVREDSGQFEYKKKWGVVVKDLPSYFLLWNGKDIPIVDPEQHEFLVKIWRKLPLAVTKAVGPWLRKGLGI